MNFINIWSTLQFIYLWVYIIMNGWLIKCEKTASSKTEPGTKLWNFRDTSGSKFFIGSTPYIGPSNDTSKIYWHQIWNKMNFQDMQCSICSNMKLKLHLKSGYCTWDMIFDPSIILNLRRSCTWRFLHDIKCEVSWYIIELPKMFLKKYKDVWTPDIVFYSKLILVIYTLFTT